MKVMWVLFSNFQGCTDVSTRNMINVEQLCVSERKSSKMCVDIIVNNVVSS